jgi:hypothetical protein
MNIKIDGSCQKKEKNIYKVEKVCILSSIGRNYYLRFPKCHLPGNGEPKTTELALARTNIISWSRQSLKQETSAKLRINTPSTKKSK